jgi:hypothetical protein
LQLKFFSMFTLIHHSFPAVRKSTIFLSCFFLTGIIFSASAQKKFDVATGIGFYELVHVGVAWNYSAKSSVGLYMGTNFNAQGIHRKDIGLSFTHIYIKPLVWKIQPGFSLKAQYWDQDDVNYYFTNLSFLFQGVLSYSVNSSLRLVMEGGGVLNAALETERKQNTTVGYPARWNGNVAFSIRYRINKKTKPS